MNDLIVKILSNPEDIAKEAKKYEGRDDVTVVIAHSKDVALIKRNFKGKVDEYNPRGYRQFSLRISDADIIKSLNELGWSIKPKTFEDDPEGVVGYISVKVNFDNERKPPIIKTISLRGDGSKVKNTITAEDCAILDSADIENIKLRLSPYKGTNPITNKPYLSVYLKTMHCTIVPDDFDCDDDEADAVEPQIEIDDMPFDA